METDDDSATVLGGETVEKLESWSSVPWRQMGKIAPEMDDAGSPVADAQRPTNGGDTHR